MMRSTTPVRTAEGAGAGGMAGKIAKGGAKEPFILLPPSGGAAWRGEADAPPAPRAPARSAIGPRRPGRGRRGRAAAPERRLPPGRAGQRYGPPGAAAGG